MNALGLVGERLIRAAKTMTYLDQSGDTVDLRDMRGFIDGCGKDFKYRNSFV
jgi:hypothetical protein